MDIFNSRKKLFLTALFFYIIVMLIAGFADLSLSNVFANPGSVFGTVFQNFGLFSQAAICLISGQIIIAWALRSDRLLYEKTTLIIGGIALGLWQLWGYLKSTISYNLTTLLNIHQHKAIGLANSDAATAHLSQGINIALTLIIFILVTIAAQLWLKNKNAQELDYLIKAAVIAVLIVVLNDTVNSTMKQYWGRVRPYELNSAQSNFTPWFHINGADGHLSFPSGHSESAALSFVLGLFISRKNYRLQRGWFIGSLIYAFLMAISRVRVEAHFLSDTMTGLFTTFLIISIILSATGLHLVERVSQKKEGASGSL